MGCICSCYISAGKHFSKQFHYILIDFSILLLMQQDIYQCQLRKNKKIRENTEKLSPITLSSHVRHLLWASFS